MKVDNFGCANSFTEIVRPLSSFIFILTLIATIGCQPEEQIFTTSPDAKLRFSADTLMFDTVFTAVPTITKRLKVYNDNNGTVNISSISLSSSSSFKMIVNGVSGNLFKDLRLLRGDSMLILLDALIDPMNENNPFIIEDSIQFLTNGNLQQVLVTAWGQDAIYLQDSVLTCDAVWTNERPYVIYNSVLVDSLCTLLVEPGASIYSHKGSAIYIKGSLKVKGEFDKRVTFLNDRLDEKFQDAPGQWEGIYFLEGSSSNTIDYADIRNGVYGIWLGTPDNDTIPDLILNGVRVENMSRTGIIAFTSDLKATNTLVNNCIDFAVGNIAGGNYTYKHCTFANYSNFFFREGPVLQVTDNLVLADGQILIDDVNLSIVNSIIWGDRENEIVLSNEGGANFNSFIESNILRSTEEFGSDNLINQDPLFINPIDYDYHLDSLSPGIDAGINLEVALDLDGQSRDSIPDLGVYERKGN